MSLLPDMILEEIFLRLPVDEPACLVRASVASKLWLHELTSARFRGRYRDFHGAPPMLGFLYYRSSISYSVPQPDLVSTTGFRARLPTDGWGGREEYTMRECRHGRVLLESYERKRPTELVVWDPMTGRRSGLVAPEWFCSHSAAVLCAVAGCDHHACHDGPFRMVIVAADKGVARAYASSPETGEWSEPSSGLDLDSDIACIHSRPSILVRDVLYFLFTYFGDDTIHILGYDLGAYCLSISDGPVPTGDMLVAESILVGMQDGCLGFACFNHTLTLRLWSRHVRSDGVASWTQHRVIDVGSLFPIQDPNRSTLIGSLEGSDIVFVTTDTGTYQINFVSLRWKKLWKSQDFTDLLPYTSFCIPRERGEPPLV